MSLELYNDVTNIREKAFKATFEIKGKALYGKLPVAFDMMREILTASKLDDEKRIKEILAMLPAYASSSDPGRTQSTLPLSC